MNDHTLIEYFLEYIWVPLLGWLGYNKRRQDRRMDILEKKVEEVDDKIQESKLYSANTYAKLSSVEKAFESISSDIRDLRALIIDRLDNRK